MFKNMGDCKRLHIEQTESKENSTEPVSWDILPVELQFKIFECTEVPALRNFARASRTSAATVLDYLQSSAGVKKIDSDLNSVNTGDRLFSIRYQRDIAVNYGQLMSAVTLGFTTRKKIDVVEKILRKGQFQRYMDDHISSSSLTAFGYFVHSFTKTWPSEFLIMAHNHLKRVSQIEEFIDPVMHSNPGFYKLNEKYIRNFFRGIYFKTSDVDDRAFWLSIILKSFSYTHQAKLLYIIFGPITSSGTIDWQGPLGGINGSLPSELKYLAKAVMSLNKDEYYQTDEVVEVIIRKIISFPEAWHHSCLALFILACGKRVLSTFVKDYIYGECYHDLTLFIIHCTTVCLRTAKPISDLVTTLNEILKSPELNASYEKFYETFLNFLNYATSEAYENSSFVSPTVRKTALALLACLSQQKNDTAVPDLYLED